MAGPRVTHAYLTARRCGVQPLAWWEFADCFAYAEQEGFGLHPLHAKGFPSVGDMHSTVPIPREDWFEYGKERAGRFQGLTNTDGSTKTECGAPPEPLQGCAYNAPHLALASRLPRLSGHVGSFWMPARIAVGAAHRPWQCWVAGPDHLERFRARFAFLDERPGNAATGPGCCMYVCMRDHIAVFTGTMACAVQASTPSEAPLSRNCGVSCRGSESLGHASCGGATHSPPEPLACGPIHPEASGFDKYGRCEPEPLLLYFKHGWT